MLALYRDGFETATVSVASKVKGLLFCKSTIALRPSKSTLSIIAKLKREKSRLSQMQDIGGLRIIVAKISQQRRLVETIMSTFPGSRIVDRIASPRANYRSIHVVINENGHLIEIQIRTRLQNQWAQISEKYADEYGQEVKYGGGPEWVRHFLQGQSEWIATVEKFEESLDNYKHASINDLLRKRRTQSLSPEEEDELKEYHEMKASLRAMRIDGFRATEQVLRPARGGQLDILNSI
jgi:ppGpp synthetase/RelA/SpoT-type nucleotidyltranferase